MYTKLDDERKARFIKQYIDKNPNCTRKDIVQDTVTNWVRLQSLARQGYFTLPRMLDYGERNASIRKNM